MRPRIDYVGDKFGRLTAIAEADPKPRKDRPGSTIRCMECICECGTSTFVTVPDLKSGNTTSCGCAATEARKANKTHGMAQSVSRNGRASNEYEIWNGIIGRCEQPKHSSYKYYGARGIKMCDRWRKNFENFYADMGPRPSKQHSIDRIDNDGDYAPENCRWATGKTQFRNSRISEEFLFHMRRGR